MPAPALLIPTLLACTLVPQADSPPVDTGPLFTPDPAWSEPERLQVATFNADWLWDHEGGEYEPRTQVDFEMVGRLLWQHDLDLVALQEVDGEGALARLDLPPQYAWAVGESGWSQNPAILYDQTTLSVTDVREVPLPGTSWPSKDPLLARVTWLEGDLSFTFVVVHLNPFEDEEEAQYRAMQVQELHRLLTEELPAEGSPWGDHVIVAGDWNDTFEGINSELDTLAPFEQDPAWTFATWDTTDYTQIGYRSKIDHILLSAPLVARYVDAGQPGACKVIAHDQLAPWSTYEGGWGGEQVVSDHRPVWIYLE